jgi:hypothetical protein
LRFISQAQLTIRPPLKIGYADQNYTYRNLSEYKVFDNEIKGSMTNYRRDLTIIYANFVSKFIFKPCGMQHSLMDADLSRLDVAKAFDNEFKPTPCIQLTTGFVRLTVADLYRFVTRLEQFEIISKASFDKLAANFPDGESMQILYMLR